MTKSTSYKTYDDDAPLTKTELRRLRPAREVDPELVAAHKAGTLKRGRGRPPSSNKTPISIRVDNDVLEFFKAKGAGWQTRMGDALRAFVDVAR
ncbi:MAG: BrnA antitoxin family protein [Bdellovibrionales bacterium]|jgi:uncharacterized protein (DUF4415 family)